MFWNLAVRMNINHILVDLPTPRYNEALDGKGEAGERPSSGCLPDHVWDISGIFLGYLFTCPSGRDLGTSSPFFATSGLGQNPGEVQLSHHLPNRSFLTWLEEVRASLTGGPLPSVCASVDSSSPIFISSGTVLGRLHMQRTYLSKQSSS